MDQSKKIDNPNPLLKANFLSKIFFLWQVPLYQKGYNDGLTNEDFYNLLKEDQSQSLGDQLERNWNKELSRAKEKNQKPKLLKAILSTFFKPLFLQGIILAFESIFLKLAIPILLGRFISYFEPSNEMSKSEGYIYALSLILFMLFDSIFTHHPNKHLDIIGMRIKIACCSLMYRKALRLNNESLSNVTSGEIVNLMSNDVERFDMAIRYLNYLWIVPIQALVLTYLLYRSVGVCAIFGIVIFAIINFPIQGLISRLLAKYRLKIATRTDERIKLMNEVISAIQIIKFYAWEKPFEALVHLSRKLELEPLIRSARAKGLQLTIIMFTDRFGLYITLVLFVLNGNSLTSEILFSTGTFFNMVKTFMGFYFPQAMSLGGETMVSIRRIQNFLLKDEGKDNLNNNSFYKIPNLIEDNLKATEIKKSTNLIRFNNITALWTKKQMTPSLNKISFEVKPGQLIGIVGPVGSGKSSIFKVLLNELPISGGNLELNGQLSYASQDAWLFQSTVQNNILFGLPYDEQRYKKTVTACALLDDFKQLPFGDKTLIGDRGSGLSGGQKARVNLARAVYRQVDIYLLDDPLSAVDTRVGRHLYEKCIVKYLLGKTRILITHQIQYLENCDLIIVMDNGEIEKQGTWTDLCRDKNFINFMKQNETEETTRRDSVCSINADRLGRRRSSVLSQNFYEIENDIEEEPKETEELMSHGGLKFKVIKKYFHSGGSWCFIIFCFSFLVLSQVLYSGIDYWLTFWVKQEMIRDQIDSFSGNYLMQDELVLTQHEGIIIYSSLIAITFAVMAVTYISFNSLSMNASQSLHDQMFACVIKATMRFFDTNSAGRVLNRFSKDIGIIDDLLPTLISHTFITFLFVFFIIVLVLISNVYLIFALLISGYGFSMIRKYYVPTAQDITRLKGINKSPMFSHLVASIDGIITIRSCNAEQLLIQEFDNHQNLHTKSDFFVKNTSASLALWLDMISITLTLIISCVFLIFFDNSTFSGQVGLAITQALQLTGSVQYGLKFGSDMVTNFTSVERVLEYTKLEKEGPFETDAKEALPKNWPSNGQIKMKNLYLKYDSNGLPTLKNINIVIEGGTKVGVVGRTGAGKSSMVASLFRLAYIEGDVLIDNMSILKIGLNDLRIRLSIIPQQPVLFSASLRYNLDPFNKSTDEEIWNALEEVELKDIAQNLDFKISAGGSNLSVGQRQLLCLARAILRKNKILIMDEATANVDRSTDNLIQNTIRMKFKDCTVMTIAHRLNTIIDNDKVIVLDDGRVLEYDHAHILLQNPNGAFSQMLKQMGQTMETNLKQLAKEDYLSRHSNKL